MKKIIFLGLALLGLTNLSAQEVQEESSLTKKGKVFVFWGWNRAAYSNSDIRFKGAGYDFTLKSVVGNDRPTKFTIKDYFAPDNLTIPQTNARIGYFVKDDIAIVLGLDHMKYVMDQNQTVDFTGHICDPQYATMVQNGQVDLSDQQFLTFEHTDGLNYINIGAEKYKNLLNKKNIGVEWAYGAGAGVLLPKTNAKLFGFERSDRFHVAGFGIDARTSINAIFWKHLMLRVEGKFGYINMPDIKSTLNDRPDKAQQDFVFGQINFGVGYIFGFNKKK